MSDVVAARVRALPPDQLSMLVLRLRDHVRRRTAAPPSPILVGVDIDQLSDGAVDEMLAQLVAADGESAAVLAAPARPEQRYVDELSDDDVTAMLRTLLAEESK